MDTIKMNKGFSEWEGVENEIEKIKEIWEEQKENEYWDGYRAGYKLGADFVEGVIRGKMEQEKKENEGKKKGFIERLDDGYAEWFEQETKEEKKEYIEGLYDVYKYGYKKGIKEGENEGYKNGYTQGVRETEEEMKQDIFELQEQIFKMSREIELLEDYKKSERKDFVAGIKSKEEGMAYNAGYDEGYIDGHETGCTGITGAPGEPEEPEEPGESGNVYALVNREDIGEDKIRVILCTKEEMIAFSDMCVLWQGYKKLHCQEFAVSSPEIRRNMDILFIK